MDEIEVTNVLKRYCDKKVERVIKSLLFTQCHFNHKFKVRAKEKIEINQAHKRIDPMRLRMCTQEMILNDRWNAEKLVRNLLK